MAEDRPLLAVLIDADNVPAKYARAIMNEVAGIGEPAVRRVYGDWAAESLKGWRGVINELGLVAKQETANTKGKNASDIGLVIGAMDLLYGGIYDGFVIVSSDSDYTALASRLREEGRTVIGIGEKKTPVSLVNVCNRFIWIENISEEAAKEAEREAAKDAKTAFERAPKPEDAIPFLEAAMDKIDSGDGWYQLGGVGSVISAAKPDFDTRTYGHKKLSSLILALTRVETKQGNGQLSIRLKP